LLWVLISLFLLSVVLCVIESIRRANKNKSMLINVLMFLDGFL